ncbi:hypothetical protein [Kitasatospora sp. McL0602]|uniref:hypothetical protein n=1 Tax=Kitasatospora sp. McL0602 TaxID=3439530 RepID=UPI003F8B737C
MDGELTYRAVLAVDIESSAGRGNTALLRIRDVLAAALRESAAQSGIDWGACLIDDLGDGFRVVAPAGVRKAALLHPLVHELTARLRAHNRTAGPSTRIRVRIALHAGELWLAGAGRAAGRPLEVLARLLDAAAARTLLAEAPESTCAVVILSPHFHEETVPHGYPGIEPELFREVTVTNKEFTTRAWAWLVGSGAVEPRAGRQRPPSGPSTMVNRASDQAVIYAMQDVGTVHVTHRPESQKSEE